jgi:predicted N-acetyltransferase YhbS
MEVALQEGLPTLTMHFFECVVDGEIVGNLTTVEGQQRPVAILQHVFTTPAHRRKGICRALMTALSEDFVARKGRAMYLGTGYESPPYWIYHSFGFRSIAGTGYMRWLPGGGSDEEYFAPGPVEVRDTMWADWPALDALYLVPEGWYLRGFRFGQYGLVSYEGAYPTLVEAREKGSVPDIKVLSKADGAVMGHAFVATQPQWKGEPYVLDFFVHPNFEDEAERLLSSLILPTDRKLQAYADTEAETRCEALEAAGFEQEALLRRQIQRGEEWLDVAVYVRR